MQILLANPRGFCAGVDRAIGIVERALEIFEHPVYVRHEVVHNRYVVENLKAQGAKFVDELVEVPDGAVVIFSAHGVPKAVEVEAARRKLQVFDATCPLVTKVHLEVLRHSQQGRECVLIGHPGHPEVVGTLGRYDTGNGGAIYLVADEYSVNTLEVTNPNNIAFVTQTTLSVDDTAVIIEALRSRFPNIVGPRKNDICYATTNRQQAVKTLAANSDLVLIVGSPNSSNSNRLREIAEREGTPAHLIDTADEIERGWFDGVRSVGISAGASAPEILVEEVIGKLNEISSTNIVETVGTPEEVVFPLPKSML